MKKWWVISDGSTRRNDEKWYSKDYFHDFSNGKLDDEYTTKRSSVEVKINGKYMDMEYTKSLVHAISTARFPLPTYRWTHGVSLTSSRSSEICLSRDWILRIERSLGVKWKITLAPMSGQVSNEKKPGWLGYIGDYTTQLYRDYNNKPL